MDAAGEVVLLLELLVVARIVTLHLAFLPDAERMGRVHVRHAQDLAQVLPGHAGIPVVAVDELVLAARGSA